MTSIAQELSHRFKARSRRLFSESPFTEGRVLWQVRQLMKAVELSGHPLQKGANMGEIQSESLKRELERKEREMQDVKNQLRVNEIEWNKKFAQAQQENVNLQNSYQSMAQSAKEEEEKALEATVKLEQLESEIETNKKQVSALEENLKEKEVKIKALYDDLSSRDSELAHLSAEFEKEKERDVIPEDVSLQMENLKKEIALLKAAAEEKAAPASPASPDLHEWSEIQTQLRQEIAELKEHLVQRENTLKEKETEIARLVALNQGNDSLETGNEMGTLEEWMDQVAERDLEIAQLKEALQSSDARIASLQKEWQQKATAYEALLHSPATLEEREGDLEGELEKRDREIQRLKHEIQDKVAEVQRLSALLESLPKKEQLISKLTCVLSEKDNELIDVRKRIQEGHERETDLIEKLTAKDGDLENVVNSLLFSQQQLQQLCHYCSDLGGDPHEKLGSLRVLE